MAQKTPIEKMTRPQLAAEILRLIIQLEQIEARERKQLQEMDALLEDVKKYRLLLDESSDPIFMFASDGTYLYVNRAFAEGVARRLDEINQRKIWDVFPPDEAEKRFTVANAPMKTARMRAGRTNRELVMNARLVAGLQLL